MQPLRLTLSVSLLLGALLTLMIGTPREEPPMRRALAEFPGSVGAWHARRGALLDADVREALNPTDYLMRQDEDAEGRGVWLFIGYWDSQRRGFKPHSPRDCLPGDGWEPLEAVRVTIPLAAPSGSITVNRYLVQKARDQQVVFYWYQAQGKAIAGELGATIEMVKSSITRGRADGALVRVSSPVYGGLQETSERLIGYIRAMYPFLGDFIPG
jgi:EpsI family protein